MRLKDLLLVLKHDAQWIGLQKEVPAGDHSVLADISTIERCGEHLADFADTAALIDTLDLVITVDTAVAHLAGALGKRVWILLPKVADWRWLCEREDSPWYPTAKLLCSQNEAVGATSSTRSVESWLKLGPLRTMP